MAKLPVVVWTVLHSIPQGAESPITTNDLSKLTGIDVREVRQIVSILINRYGVPIVARRSGSKGMFIATSEAERTDGLAAFTNQVSNMAVRIDAIRSADLEHWRDNLELIKPAADHKQEDAG